uniref:Secreted protein n=1 Tax=Macrostomum lignano TaxID=282301 RepID=A0A1I8FQX0_9PLAT
LILQRVLSAQSGGHGQAADSQDDHHLPVPDLAGAWPVVLSFLIYSLPLSPPARPVPQRRPAQGRLFRPVQPCRLRSLLLTTGDASGAAAAACSSPCWCGVRSRSMGKEDAIRALKRTLCWRTAECVRLNNADQRQIAPSRRNFSFKSGMESNRRFSSSLSSTLVAWRRKLLVHKLLNVGPLQMKFRLFDMPETATCAQRLSVIWRWRKLLVFLSGADPVLSAADSGAEAAESGESGEI